jgi:hypothetical protein
MTDDQFDRLMEAIQECKSTASCKGHFWLLVLTIGIALKTGAC